MLIVNRQIGQKIFLGEGEDAVTIHVFHITPSRVKLGFDAPRKLSIRYDNGKRDRKIQDQAAD